MPFKKSWKMNLSGSILFLDETEKGIIDSYQIREKIYALVEQLDNARQIRRIIREAFSAALIPRIALIYETGRNPALGQAN